MFGNCFRLCYFQGHLGRPLQGNVMLAHRGITLFFVVLWLMTTTSTSTSATTSTPYVLYHYSPAFKATKRIAMIVAQIIKMPLAGRRRTVWQQGASCRVSYSRNNSSLSKRHLVVLWTKSRPCSTSPGATASLSVPGNAVTRGGGQLKGTTNNKPEL